MAREARESFTIRIGPDKYNIPTAGNEPIHAAIRQDLKRHTKNFDKMFVKQEGTYFNVGLPSGVLVKENGVYDCTFKKGMVHNVCAEEYIRLYEYKSFSKDWLNELKFFYLSFEEVCVSKFHRYFLKEKVRVDFFVGENLYQAMYRDGRLLRGKLRSCEILCKEQDAIVSLRQVADNYHGKHLIVKRLFPKPDTDLPSDVLPQRFPLSWTSDNAKAQENKNLSSPSSDSPAAVEKAVKVEAKETLSNTNLVRETAQSIPQEAAMTSSSASKKPILMKNDDYLAAFVSEKLGLDVKRKENKIEEKKRLTAIAKFTGKFSLQPYHRTYTKDMMLLMQMRESVGAICATVGGRIVLHGTCFRVGSIYVLTCNHVVNDLISNNISAKDIFVTFNYEEQPLESPNILKCSLAPGEYQVVFCDEQLDFAMLKMDYSPHLPKPITQYGFELDTTGDQLREGKGLTLIGHPGPRNRPGNEPKQIDTFCPIDHSDEAKEHYLYIQHHGITYHVTSFGHSSSGSPGVSVERKKVIAIHSRGIPLDSVDTNGTCSAYSIEQGTRLSSVIEFVRRECTKGNMDITEFFGKLPEPQTPISRRLIMNQ